MIDYVLKLYDMQLQAKKKNMGQRQEQFPVNTFILQRNKIIFIHIKVT